MFDTLPHPPHATLRRYRGEYMAHSHAFAQVLCAADGQLQLEVDGRSFVVEPGRGLVVPPGAAHAYLADRAAAVWVIDVPAAAGLDRVRPFASRAQLDDLDALDTALDASLHETWSVDRMAAACHFSTPRFHARLLERTGFTPQAYLRHRRLDRAARLLAAGLTLDAAALQVGYRSASALAFALRRERGVGVRHLR